MGNNVIFQDDVLATAPDGTVVETIDEGSGVERQVVAVGSIGQAGAEVQLRAGSQTSASSLPVVIASDQGAIPVAPNATPGSAAHLKTVVSVGAAPSAAAIKASNGIVYGYQFYNNSSVVVFVKIYDKAFGSVTVGVTAPVLTIGVAPGKENNKSFAGGWNVGGTGISYAITTGIADNDTGSVNADDIHGGIEWL